jgi:predicted metal-dependent hydrolase
MTTEDQTISVAGIEVLVVRKEIRNLHLGVYPPDGHVRIAVPSVMPDSAVRAAVAMRLDWIRRHRGNFEGQARESAREMVTGESHWYLGRRYRLSIVETTERTGVRIVNHSVMELRCRSQSTARERTLILEQWYRARLRTLAAPLIRAWAAELGVCVGDWRIRKMKTRWGSCGIENERIWLNLELAKKPRRGVEYVVVHELAHLRERRHGTTFQTLLDEHMPRWRFLRAELGSLPVPAFDESWHEGDSTTVAPR